MTADVPREIDWLGWFRRWEVQQENYVADREAHFAAMFDAISMLLPESFVAVDLGSGPGAISQRVLARFRGARVVAVDIDPVLLAIGKGALGTMDGRLRWVEADLAVPSWVDKLGESQVDAVLSTTALHWLTSEQLVSVYRCLGRLVRPGGVLINGDNSMPFAPSLPSFRRLAEHAVAQRLAAAEKRNIETWQQWWDDAAREPLLAPLVVERERLFAAKPAQPSRPIIDLHIAALRDADFREVGTLWQSLTNRGILAVR